MTSPDKVYANTNVWIPVTERLPEEGDEIEGWAKGTGGTWTEAWDGDEPVGRMTHWRLL